MSRTVLSLEKIGLKKEYVLVPGSSGETDGYNTIVNPLNKGTCDIMEAWNGGAPSFILGALGELEPESLKTEQMI